MAKGCSTTSNKYEAAKEQRIEENKKRFEDLGISKISKTLNEIARPTKKSMNRLFNPKSKTNVVLEPRHSSRARNSIPSYAETLAQTFHSCRSGQGHHHGEVTLTLQGYWIKSK